LVVQLDRLEVALEPPPRFEDLEPVLRCLFAAQLGRLGDVPPAPDDDRVAALHVLLLEVRVGHLAREEPRAVLGLLEPSLLAHRTALAALQLVERPRPVHASDVSSARPAATLAVPATRDCPRVTAETAVTSRRAQAVYERKPVRPATSQGQSLGHGLR